VVVVVVVMHEAIAVITPLELTVYTFVPILYQPAGAAVENPVLVYNTQLTASGVHGEYTSVLENAIG
jgi:hypothetical protein